MNAWLNVDSAWQLAGWTMLHFLWIGAVVAIVGAAIRVACRRAAPGVRYAVSLMTLLALALAPAGIARWLMSHPSQVAMAASFESPRDSTTWGSRSETGNARPATVAPQVIDLAKTPIVNPSPTPSPGEPGRLGPGVATVRTPSPNPSAPQPLFDLPDRGVLNAAVAYLPWVWIIGAPLTLLLLAAGLIGSQRLRGGSTALDSGPAADACARLRGLMRITQRVIVAASDAVAQPVLVGIVRPTILLPAAALTGWSPEELEMVLLHELAHVRRWDNLVNLGQRLVESLLFFHPAVWLASRQVRLDREECCDALVVRHTQRPAEYAELLVAIAGRTRRGGTRLAEANLAWASAMADHPLAGRVRRILKLEDETMRVSRSTLGVALAVMVAGGAAGLFLPTLHPAQAADEANTPAQSSGSYDPIKPYWEQTLLIDPALMEGQRALFKQSADNPIEERTYDIDKGMPGWAEQVLSKRFEDMRKHPRGPQVNFEFEVLNGGNQMRIVAPKLAHDRLFKNWLSLRVGPAVPVAGPTAIVRAKPATVGGNSEFDREQLRDDVRGYQATLTSLEQERVDMDVLRQLANRRSRSSAAQDAQFEEELAKDRTLANYEQEMLALEKSMRQVRPTADRTKEEQLQPLAEQRDELNRVIANYRQQAEAKIRDRLDRLAEDSLKSAEVEYEIRSKSLEDRRQAIEQKLKEALERLQELSQSTSQETYAGTIVADSPQNLPAATAGQPELLGLARDFAPATPGRPVLPPGRLLEPGDAVKIAVNGAIPDQPISDDYVIEPEGTVALGPTYGRVNIAGLTVLNAESVVKDHLKKFLAEPEVQLTLRAPASPAQHVTAGWSGLTPARPLTAESPLAAPAGDLWSTPTTAALAPQKIPLQHGTPSAPTIAPPATMSPHFPAPKATLGVDRSRYFYQPSDNAKPKAATGPEGATSDSVPGPPEFRDYHLKYAAASSVALNLNEYFSGQEGGDDPTNKPHFIWDPETNTIVARNATQQQLEVIQKLIQVYDQPKPVSPSQAQQPAAAPAEAGDQVARYLYDGKGFGQWRSLWQTELKTERRMEAIEALAAFGRAGYGREAVEAVFDVAGQYDFSTMDESAEGKLKSRVVELLTSYGAPRLPETLWLPVLEERLKAEPARWKWIAYWLLSSLQTSDAAVMEKLFELAKSKDEDIRTGAIAAIGKSDRKREDPRIIEMAEKLLGSSKPVEIMNGVSLLEYSPDGNSANVRLRFRPAIVDALFFADENVRLTARRALKNIDEKEAAPVVEQLMARLKKGEAKDERLAALRAVGALGPKAATAESALVALIDDYNDLELAAAAAVAVDRLHDGETKDGHVYHPGRDLYFKRIQALPEENEKNRGGYLFNKESSDVSNSLRHVNRGGGGGFF